MRRTTFLFFLLVHQFCISQDISVDMDYHLIFSQSYMDHLINDPIDHPEYSNAVSTFRESILSLNNQVIFSLKYCKSKSSFIKKPFLVKELKPSKYQSIFHEYFNNGSFYITYSENKILKYETVFDKDYVIELPMPKWEIFETTKIVLGYKCYKATTTRLSSNGKDLDQITVWFAPDLNIPIAPNGFVGLPGAVLQLDLELYSLVATKISPGDCGLTEFVIPKKVWTHQAFLKEVNEINTRLRN